MAASLMWRSAPPQTRALAASNHAAVGPFQSSAIPGIARATHLR